MEHFYYDKFVQLIAIVGTLTALLVATNYL